MFMVVLIRMKFFLVKKKCNRKVLLSLSVKSPVILITSRHNLLKKSFACLNDFYVRWPDDKQDIPAEIPFAYHFWACFTSGYCK